VNHIEKHVHLSAIQFDSATQIRVEINDAAVREYAEAMNEGAKFPPVALFEDDGKFFIGDGWHRLLAAQKNGDVTIPAVVFQGTLSTAVVFALGANAKHGMLRTNADKRKAVTYGLQALGNMSNVEIAKICAVSDEFVRKIRGETQPPTVGACPEKRLGGDGKTYSVPARREQPATDGLVFPSRRIRHPAVKFVFEEWLSHFTSMIVMMLDRAPKEHRHEALLKLKSWCETQLADEEAAA